MKNSGYHSNQIVQIIPSNDTFDEIMDEVVFADFKNQVFKIISRNDIIDRKEGFKVMKLSVRPEIITCVIENKLP